MPVINPLSWSVLGFGDETAWIDFLGHHALWGRAFDQHVRLRLAAGPYPTPPLGDGGGAEWDEAHQLWHVGARGAVLLPPPPDFRSYDRRQREQFATWCFLHAQEHHLIQVAAGL
jgi:hypothetical protein